MRYWTRAALGFAVMAGVPIPLAATQHACEEDRFGARHYSTGWVADDLTEYDLNEDGILDLIASDSTSLLFYLCGDGTQPVLHQVLELGAQPRHRVVGDVNHDGRADLVVTFSAGGGVVLLRNDDATFADPIALPDVLSSWLALGDVNDDGFTDLVTYLRGDDTGYLLLWTGSGTGYFTWPSLLLSGPRYERFCIADIDADGLNDLVAYEAPGGGGAGPRTVLLPGRPGPAFDAPVPLIENQYARDPRAVDLDADGDLDLLQHSSARVSVLWNQGGVLAEPLHIETGHQISCMTVADMDGDGRSDLVAAGEQATIFEAQSDGSFEWSTTFVLANDARDISAVDVNGDGRLDLVAMDSFAATVALQSPDLGFSDWPQVLPAGLDGIRDELLADFDNDGKVDLLTLHTSDHTIELRYGDGRGSFGLPVSTFMDTRPHTATTADFDGDGRLDVATINGNDEPLSLLLGSSSVPFVSGTPVPISRYPSCVAAGDLTNDGMADVIVSGGEGAGGGGPNFLTLLHGNGAGGFPTRHEFEFDAPATELHVVDLDGDGWNDLLAAYPVHGLALRWGSADGLSEPVWAPTGDHGVWSVATGDLDADGTLDLVLILRDTTGDEDLLVLRQPAPRSFETAMHDPLVNTNDAPLLVDVNADGLLDLVLRWSIRRVGVYLGRGDGTAHPPRWFALGYNDSCAAADLNCDGAVDLILTDSSGAIRVAVNRCTPCPEDFDADGQIGWSDLIMLLDAWGGDITPFDLDHDGEVGASDLGRLLVIWGPCR